MISETSIVARTIPEGWEESIVLLLSKEWPLIPTQRGVRAREIAGLTIHVTEANAEPYASERYMFGDGFAERYCQRMTSLNPETIGISTRISRPDGRYSTQISKVVNLLKQTPYSRRAVLTLWDQAIDVDGEHPPCLCSVQFLMRDDALTSVAYFRSNDAWMAALPDMLSLRMISLNVAKQLNVPFASYIHVSASYHMYEPDILPAELAFERILQR